MARSRPATGSSVATPARSQNHPDSVAKPGQGALVNGPTGKTTEPAHAAEFRRCRGPFRVPDSQGVQLGRQVRGLLRDPDRRQLRRRQADGQPLRRNLPAGRDAAQVPSHRRGDSATCERGPAAGRVADARRHLPRASIRLRRQEDRERPLREGDLERPGDPRERRSRSPTGHVWRLKEVAAGRSCCKATTGRWRFATSGSAPD